MQTNYFQLELLSPVHIGTGEALDPMSYLMRVEDGIPACYVVDALAWAGEVEDPAALATLFSADNVPAMRRHMATEIDPEIYALRRLTVSSEGIYREYESKLGDQQTTNQLLFSPLTTTANRVPVIPGSSIKGAIRTAVIDWLDREQRLDLKSARAKDKSTYNQRLERVLGGISNSAFKQLKVGDVDGWADTTLLVEALELGLKEGKSATPKNKCEVMPSRLLGSAEDGRLHLCIAMGDPKDPGDRRLSLPRGPDWDWTALTKIVNAYYQKRFAAEKAKFYSHPAFAKARAAHKELEAQLETAPGQMILRVGHYSQVEFVTVTNNDPFTRRTKNGKLPYGTTRTLADGRYPFGWIKLTPCNADDHVKGTSRLQDANRAIIARRQAGRVQALAVRENRLTEMRRREEAAQKQAEAEKQRQEALAALPQEERQVVLLEQGALNDNQVFELYEKISELEQPLQKRAANGLKELWIAQGRWKKKACSKKQAKKVAAIKKILAAE